MSSTKVSQEQMTKLPYIIAVDFDGTIAGNDYPEILSVNEPVITLLRAAKNAGAKLILWTCRNGELLHNAVVYCKQHGIYFDAVNRNIPEVIAMFGVDSRKVYANEYWDDKAVVFGRNSAYDEEDLTGLTVRCHHCGFEFIAHTKEGFCPVCLR